MDEQLIVQPGMRRLEALLEEGVGATSRRVRQALEDDDYSRALSEANRDYARRGSSDMRAVLVYACLLVGRELVVEARGLLDKAIEEEGTRPEYAALMADALLLEGDPDAAREWLERIDPDALERPTVAAFVADVHLDLGDRDEAIAYYQKAVDGGIDDVEPAIRLGQMYLADDRLEEAVVAFEYGARMEGDRLGLWRMVADLNEELGREERALEAKQRVYDIEGASCAEWLHLGLRLTGVRRFEAALEALNRAHRLEPADPEPILSRGHILLELGRAEEAIAAFGQLEKLGRGGVELDFGLASAALMMGDLTLAEERAERAVETDPNHPDAQHTLGVVRQEWGRHDEALEAFDEAIALDDTRPAFFESRALSLAATGQSDEALESLGRTLELNPDALAAAADLALAFTARGTFDRARRALQMVETSAKPWTHAEAFIEMVLALAEADEDSARDIAARFEERLDEESPRAVELDEPGWRRIARSLGDRRQQVVEEWLDRLE